MYSANAKFNETQIITQLGRRSLEDYMYAMEGIGKYNTVINDIQDADCLVFEGEPDIDYSIGLGIEVITCYDIECEDENILEQPINLNTSEMISVLNRIDVISTKYETSDEFYPFNQQHSDIADMGDFIFDSKRIKFIFPNVGFDFLTNEYLTSIGRITPYGLRSQSNLTSHIAYAMRPYSSGTDFMVFGVDKGDNIDYYLWDDTNIKKIRINSVCSGIKCNGRYKVYYREEHLILPDNFIYISHSLMNSQMFKEKDDILINIDGIDLLVVKKRKIILANDGLGQMVDKDYVVYNVDQSVKRNGLYIYDNGQFGLLYTTIRRPNTTLMIQSMLTLIATVDDLICLSMMLTNQDICMPLQVKAEICSTPEQVSRVIKDNKFPLIKRYKYKENSLDQLIYNRVKEKQSMLFGINNEDKKLFFIGNHCYTNNNYNKSILIIDKKEENGKKYVWLKFYSHKEYGSKDIKKYIIYKIRRFGVGNYVSVPIQSLKEPVVYSFYGELKTYLLDLHYEFHKIKVELLKKISDEKLLYYDSTIEDRIRDNVVG